MSKNAHEKGVTITELLVVMAIIVFLALLAIIFLRTQIFKGNDARRKGDIHKIQVAVEEYEKDTNCYPLPSLVVCDPGTGLKPYISIVPCDPTTDASYFYEHEDSACPRWYRIYSSLESEGGSCGPGDAFNYYAGSPNAPSDDCSEDLDNNGGGGGPPAQQFYGCFGGVCSPINWDINRPGPVCDPNYGSPTCYGDCLGLGGLPDNECTSWN